MSYWVLKNKRVIPGFLFKAVASWAIAVTLMTIVGVVIWSISLTHPSVLKSMPTPLSVLLGLCGAYAGIGAICLYVAMWTYWIAVERSSVAARIGWLLALLLGVHYGATIYAYYVWRTSITRVPGGQLVPSTSTNS
jgi:hypothetical protein